jgi:hypothetical protein
LAAYSAGTAGIPVEAARVGGEVQPSRIECERIDAPEPPGQRRI